MMVRALLGAGLSSLWLTVCTGGASVGAPCSTDDQCATGQYCVNGACSGAVACTRDDACADGQVCGTAGLCEPETALPETCQVTADCPLRAYCNTSLPQPTCILLQAGSCRDASQCSGQVCSALPGGVGRCVACVTGDQCASGACLSDGTCGGSAVDGGSGFDAAGATDPACGGDGQRCCSTTQPTACDSAALSCLQGFPGASDAYCWRRCSAVACTTLEDGSGWCHISSTGQGSCQAAQAWTCTSTAQCQQLGASGACVYFDDVNAYCFAMGCDWQADCGSGYYCSTYDGNLCLAVSMLGG